MESIKKVLNNPEELAEILYKVIKRCINDKNARKREEIRRFRLDYKSEQSVNYRIMQLTKKGIKSLRNFKKNLIRIMEGKHGK